jgi:class 3 adenylate cyclase
MWTTTKRADGSRTSRPSGSWARRPRSARLDVLLTAVALLAASCAGGADARAAAESTWRLPADIAAVAAVNPGDWRYRIGDDPAWSSPDFDDSSWAVGSPGEIPRQWAGRQWTGQGWFRLRLDASALPAPTPLVFDLVPCGAAEIFLDGRRVAQIGRIGDSFATEEAVRRNDTPPLLLVTPGVHLLAVRYSNFYGLPVSRIDPRAGGFTLRLAPPAEWMRDALEGERQTYGQLMFFIAVPLLLAALHFALFAFAPRMRESLYCALFLCALSAMTFTRLELERVRTVSDYLVTHRFFLIAIAAFSLLCLLTTYRTFAQPKRLFFKVACVLGLVLLVWPLFDESLLTFRVCAAFGFVVSMEAVRVTALAVRRGHPGSVLVLGGLALFGLAVLYNALRVFGWVPEQAYSTDTMNFGILAAALGLSLFIARNYALTAQRLVAEEREKQALIAAQKDRLEIEVRERTKELAEEKTQSENLLHNILPREIAAELKQKGASTPRRFEEVTILFSDFSGFTSTVSAIPAHRLIRELDEIFRGFDEIMDREGLEKIKTIGDAYMAAGGLSGSSSGSDHAHRCVRAALAMQEAIKARNEQAAIKWQMRIGLHAGPLVAGVVGKRKFTFDVFGDTVNLASRMETSATPGEINLSAYTYDLIRDEFACEYRGKLEIKGKGALDLYTVRGRV